MNEKQLIDEILSQSKSIAIYGMSKDISKAAHTVPLYMFKREYNVIPINPTTDKIYKLTCYPSLESVPEHIDLLNIFRPQEEAEKIVQEAIIRKNKVGDIKYIWLQLGLSNANAKKLAEENGIKYIEDKCIYVEHKNFIA